MSLLSEFNSSDFADIQDCIEHSKTNKLTLSNVSKTIFIKGIMEVNDSHLFQDYYDYIMSNLLVREINIDKYRYKPEYVSYDIYGTTDLWYLILWINNMGSALDFTKKTINIFNPGNLDFLNKAIEKQKEKILETKDNPIVIDDLTIKPVAY